MTQSIIICTRHYCKLRRNDHSVNFGQASNPDAGSWTWFTAGTIRKQDGVVENESQNSFGAIHLNREREVLRNEVASRAMKTYIIEWITDSENEEESRWISALENGD